MNYKGNPEYKHGCPSCTGILITNLGTPDEPTASSVRKYLAEFLSDPRIIELPKYLWWLVLHGVILRIRPSRSAKAYKKNMDRKRVTAIIYFKKTSFMIKKNSD